MDYARPPPSFAALAKTFTNLLRLRRVASNSGGGGAAASEAALSSIKLSGDYFGERDKEMEALVANLFAGVSAIKAAYAQLQVAQAPYDPDAIQSADRAVVMELKRLSALKQSYLKNQFANGAAQPQLLDAQIREQRNLLKTYKITSAKLDSELQSKDSELVSLESELRVTDKRCRALDARLRPGRTLAALDDLHLSGLNPTHFLTLLRSTVKSIRSFIKIMTREMESASWDLDAAACAIQPDLLHRQNSKNRFFAFQSFVSRLMFCDFQKPNFGHGCPARDRRQFFMEFSDLKFAKLKDCFEKKYQFGKFCLEKYLRMVHPKMEASFFGNTEYRALMSTGRGFPETPFFDAFADMARQVWLLHCLFFSFGAEENKAIFVARRGSRFSEVYMKSVEDDLEIIADGVGDRRSSVGFTVVPGFKVGRIVIQCRVYLMSGDS